MLLPPDLRDWVSDDDMVHFVIEAVEGMRLKTLKANRRGSGSAQYPPKMMLALLIYCYANGIFSSRKIERATYRDVAVRYLTGDTHPDHDTIATFRRENFVTVGEAFLEVPQLARSLRVLKVGTVSVDGTHLRANASKDRNVRYDRAGELDRQLKEDIDRLLEQAEQTDRDEDDDGQSLPKEIGRRQKLREKMRKAREELERRAKQKAAAEQEAYEQKCRERDQRSGRRKGPRPKPPRQTPEPDEQVNLTDADSRLMRKSKRSSYQQVYNAQATVDADGSQLILAGHVSTCASDANELQAGIENVPKEIGSVTAALADTGYVHADAWDALDDDVDLYVAVGREENHSQRQYDFRPTSAGEKPSKTIKDQRLLDRREKLKTDAGRELYAKRKQTVEPVFGIIKQVMGFRQFLLRGLPKVTGEWELVRLAYNVKRLWALKTA